MSQMPNRAALEFDLLDRLHKSLRVSGKSAAALAADLGVHRNTISNYLNGKTAVDRRTLLAWAFSTGVPVEWLEHGTTETGPDPDGDGEPAPPAGQVRGHSRQGAAMAKLTAAKRSRAHGASVTRAYPRAA